MTMRKQSPTKCLMSKIMMVWSLDLGFPQLQGIGGFEMLHCLPNCRDLRLIDCSWTVVKVKFTGDQFKGASQPNHLLQKVILPKREMQILR
jgi:hypothetical protein